MWNHEISALTKKQLKRFREMTYLVMNALIELDPALYHRWQGEQDLLRRLLFLGPRFLQKKITLNKEIGLTDIYLFKCDLMGFDPNSSSTLYVLDKEEIASEKFDFCVPYGAGDYERAFNALGVDTIFPKTFLEKINPILNGNIKCNLCNLSTSFNDVRKKYIKKGEKSLEIWLDTILDYVIYYRLVGYSHGEYRLNHFLGYVDFEAVTIRCSNTIASLGSGVQRVGINLNYSPNLTIKIFSLAN